MLCTIRLSSIHLFLPTIKSFITEILGNFFKEYDKSIVTWLRYIKNSQTVKKHILKTQIQNLLTTISLYNYYFSHDTLSYNTQTRDLCETLIPPPLPPLETFMKKMNRKCIWLEFFLNPRSVTQLKMALYPKLKLTLILLW